MQRNNNSQKVVKKDRAGGYAVLSFLLILGVWQLMTLFFSPFVVPRIGSVCTCLFHIFSHKEFYEMIGLTIIRQIIGVAIGVFFGIAGGIIMGRSQVAKNLISPLIHLFQIIPPVSWVVLALVWFGFNGKPAVFIVVISTIPIIAINVCEGIENIDMDLLEMAVIYQFSKKEKWQHVILPSIYSYFLSGFKVALGNGWKIVVMGELLTTSDGIGGMIKLARLNVEPENIIAWSIVMVLLFYLSSAILNLMFDLRGGHNALCEKYNEKF